MDNRIPPHFIGNGERYTPVVIAAAELDESWNAYIVWDNDRSLIVAHCPSFEAMEAAHRLLSMEFANG